MKLVHPGEEEEIESIRLLRGGNAARKEKRREGR